MRGAYYLFLLIIRYTQNVGILGFVWYIYKFVDFSYKESQNMICVYYNLYNIKEQNRYSLFLSKIFIMVRMVTD